MTKAESDAVVIMAVQTRGEIVTDCDGFAYWWPTPNKGHYAAHHLRAIADHLDKVNEDWQREIDKYFAGFAVGEI